MFRLFTSVLIADFNLKGEMVKFGTGLALVCLQFYFLTGLSARRPYCKCTHIPLAPPSNPNHPFYKGMSYTKNCNSPMTDAIYQLIHKCCM